MRQRLPSWNRGRNGLVERGSQRSGRFGEKSPGRHLGNAAGARLVAARALDTEPVPAALATGALVVEDVVARAFDERALFHLLNLAAGGRCFPAAHVADCRRWTGNRPFGISIPASRPCPSSACRRLTTTLLRAVLVKLFADRQLAIEENVIGYIASRIERSFAAARSTVERLDTEAMRRKRPVTRALAAEILQERAFR